MASFFLVDDKATGARARTALGRAKPASVALADQTAPADDSAFATPSSLRRAQVCPPSLFTRSGPRWKQWMSGLWAWLWDLDETPDAAPVLTGLNKVRSEFCAAMWDLQSVRANQVRDAVERARSLRELWHLRADVFRAISTQRGQAEATTRIEALNNHFPIRVSRTANDTRPGRTTTW